MSVTTTAIERFTGDTSQCNQMQERNYSHKKGAQMKKLSCLQMIIFDFTIANLRETN